MPELPPPPPADANAFACVKGPSGKCEPPPDVITGGLTADRSDRDEGDAAASAAEQSR